MRGDAPKARFTCTGPGGCGQSYVWRAWQWTPVSGVEEINAMNAEHPLARRFFRRWTAPEPEVMRQLRAANYLSNISDIEVVGHGLRGTFNLTYLSILEDDTRFASGLFYGLHRDVGHALYDFRSYKGTFGKGSLQIVLDRVTGRCWCDVDGFNPYQDVVNVVGHIFWEVIPHWFRRKRTPHGRQEHRTANRRLQHGTSKDRRPPDRV